MGVGTIEFNLSPEKLAQLIASDDSTTTQFFQQQEAHHLDLLRASSSSLTSTVLVQMRMKHPDFLEREAPMQRIQQALLPEGAPAKKRASK